MALELDSFQKQGALLRAQKKLMIAKPRKDPLQCSFMRLNRFTKNQQVIKIDDNTIV